MGLSLIKGQHMPKNVGVRKHRELKELVMQHLKKLLVKNGTLMQKERQKLYKQDGQKQMIGKAKQEVVDKQKPLD